MSYFQMVKSQSKRIAADAISYGRDFVEVQDRIRWTVSQIAEAYGKPEREVYRKVLFFYGKYSEALA